MSTEMTMTVLLIVSCGLLAMIAIIGWPVAKGLRIKRQVDRNYQLTRSFNRAREARILSGITR